MHKQTIDDILYVIQHMQDPSVLQNFLLDILTPQEIHELTTRWAVIKKLSEGQSQRSIRDELGTSISLVTRGSHQYKKGFGGFKVALDVLKERYIDDTKIESIRKKIDGIDQKILSLLSERMQLMPKVAAYKHNNNLNLTDLKREEIILEKKRKAAQKLGISSYLIDALFQNLFEESKQKQIASLVNFSEQEVKLLRKNNPKKTIILSIELHNDTDTPIAAFSKLYAQSTHAFLFESLGQENRFDRYSFMGFSPKQTFIFLPDKTVIHTLNGTTKQSLITDPLIFLKEQIGQNEVIKAKNLPRFVGGLVGQLGYEYITALEAIGTHLHKDGEFPYDGMFAEYNQLVIFDHLKQKIILTAALSPDEDIKESYHTAIESLSHTLQTIQNHVEVESISKVPEEIDHTKYISNFTKTAFTVAIKILKKHIYNGDIFQGVLSQKFTCPAKQSLFDVYRKLRQSNPSPYMYLVKFGDVGICGASPETFVQVEDRQISLCALAGTYPRSDNEAEDKQLAIKLTQDAKERAEHMMLVDLARNDLGKASTTGSVEVEKLCFVKKLSKVMHLTSEITGLLKPGLHAIDALKAVFPRGTLTGAPKIRAMNILAQIEPCRRGPYGGAVGYIGYDGNLDAAICIRSVAKHNGVFETQAGAGIVMDSDPQKEYEESFHKAGPQLRCMI